MPLGGYTGTEMV